MADRYFDVCEYDQGLRDGYQMATDEIERLRDVDNSWRTMMKETIELRSAVEAENAKLRAALELARKMRATQVEYFKTRSRDMLIASKVAETLFDKEIAALNSEKEASNG